MVLPFKITPPRLVALAAVVLFLLWCVGSSVSLLLSRRQLQTAWQDVYIQESGRVAALAELENTTTSVAPFETETFTALAEARLAWAEATSLTEQVAAIHALNEAEAGLRAALEQYEGLDVIADYPEQQSDLASARQAAENARLVYDQAVQLFNVRLLVFPRNILAVIFGIESAPRYKFAESGPSS